MSRSLAKCTVSIDNCLSFAHYGTRPCLTRAGADFSKQLCGDDCEGGERDGRLDSDNPLQDAKLGFRGEGFEVGTGHRPCGDRAGDGFGLAPFHACRFKGAGGAECNRCWRS